MSTQEKRRTTLKAAFFTGLVILIPVLVTTWTVNLIFGQISSTVTPFVQDIIRLTGLEGGPIENFLAQYVAPIFSVFLAGGMIIVLGMFGGHVIGKQLIGLVERLLMQIPFVRTIYSATRQFLETFSTSGTKAFQKAILFQYPREGLWTLGLLTNDVTGEIHNHTPDTMVSVFVPTTPNPTSGWLIFVPVNDMVELDMSVDDAFKLIISGGVLTPHLGDSPRSVE